MSGELILQKFRQQVDDRLGQLCPSTHQTPNQLHEAMRYSALAPGKRLRPVLTMAAAELFGQDPLAALDAGCATELVHCFSLIHDDLPAIDNDDLRRGRPTCHKMFGEAMAILAGDALFALAFETMAQCHPQPEITTQCVKALAIGSGSQGLVGGEVLDILSEGKVGSMELLKTIHARKTGALLGVCCEVGALIGGASTAQAKDLARFGVLVGLAFQVADDVLNETSTAEQLGKAVGSDLELEKLTYPRLIGLEKSRKLAQDMIEEAILYLDPYNSNNSNLKDLAAYAIHRDL